jgi:hypothetical protein
MLKQITSLGGNTKCNKSSQQFSKPHTQQNKHIATYKKQAPNSVTEKLTLFSFPVQNFFRLTTTKTHPFFRRHPDSGTNISSTEDNTAAQQTKHLSSTKGDTSSQQTTHRKVYDIPKKIISS